MHLLHPPTTLSGILVLSCASILSFSTEIILINPFSAAWTTYGTFKIPSTWSWRIPSALQALPSVAQVFLVLFAPESPRWLLSKGKDDRALKTLAYYHADGNVYASSIVLPRQPDS